MTNPDKVQLILTLLKTARLTVMSANGLNRHAISSARSHESAVQVKTSAGWEFLGGRSPVYAGTDKPIW